MSTFVSNNVSSGAVIYAADHNEMGSRIAAVVNGGIDSTNISPTAAISGSQLATGAITDTQLDTSVSAVTRGSETLFDFVASGCVWTADAAGSTRLASMTAGVVYIGGKRVAVSAVTSRTFTASKDVYVDVDNTGTLAYADGTTNAASGALAANSIRLAIVVVGASSIAAAASINQGQEDRVLPIASSIPYTVTDSLGNLICPRDSQRKTIGYRRLTGNFTTTSTSVVQVTGLTVPVMVPTGRKICIRAFVGRAQVSAITYFIGSIWDGVVSSGTQLADGPLYNASAGTGGALTISTVVTPSAGSKTYNFGVFTLGASTLTVAASSTSPAYVSVELV